MDRRLTNPARAGMHQRRSDLLCRSSLAAFFFMKVMKVKTARFSEIVERSGQPESYTLWQKPRQDRHLQSQIKNNRLMTIQRSESGTEFGIVGFKERKGARYL